MENDDPLSQHMLDLPSSTKKDLAAVNSSLATSVTLWLKKHGKSVRPKLTAEQKQQMKECFELMDQDGSGAIDSEELGAAFKLLGIRMRMSELQELVAEVDHDGSGEVEYLEFLEIMTITLQRLAEEGERNQSSKSEGQVPFALMATAYRRKRLMEGIISGDKEVMTQIMQLSERQAQDAATAATRDAAEEAAMRTARGAEAEIRKMLNTITKKSLERLAAMRVNQDLLMALSPEERRLLAQVAAKVDSDTAAQSALRSPSPGPGSILPPAAVAAAAATATGKARPNTWTVAPTSPHGPPPTTHATGAHAEQPISAFGRSSSGVPQKQYPLVSQNKWQHYSRTPTHQQLLEMPKSFDIKFSKPMLKVGVSGGRVSHAVPLPGLISKGTEASQTR